MVVYVLNRMLELGRPKLHPHCSGTPHRFEKTGHFGSMPSETDLPLPNFRNDETSQSGSP